MGFLRCREAFTPERQESMIESAALLRDQVSTKQPCTPYRYLGEDFRERERIKRKKQRWVNRLHTMPTLERRALLNAIAESMATRAGTVTSGDEPRGDRQHRHKWRCLPGPLAISDDAGILHRRF
jgi:hypothetical protein